MGPIIKSFQCNWVNETHNLYKINDKITIKIFVPKFRLLNFVVTRIVSSSSLVICTSKVPGKVTSPIMISKWRCDTFDFLSSIYWTSGSDSHS